MIEKDAESDRDIEGEWERESERLWEKEAQSVEEEVEGNERERKRVKRNYEEDKTSI